AFCEDEKVEAENRHREPTQRADWKYDQKDKACSQEVFRRANPDCPVSKNQGCSTRTGHPYDYADLEAVEKSFRPSELLARLNDARCEAARTAKCKQPGKKFAVR